MTNTRLPVTSSSSAVGLVLAGGKSSRFGADKSRFRVAGVEMRVRVARALLEVVPHVVLSVGVASTVETASTIEAEGTPFDASVADIFPGRGPLSGIHAGMVRGGSELLLVAPCDMPDITSGTLENLLAAAISTDAQAVVAEHDGRLIAVLGCFRTDLADDAAAILGDPLANTSIEAFVRSLPRWTTVRLPPQELRNVNREHDVR